MIDLLGACWRTVLMPHVDWIIRKCYLFCKSQLSVQTSNIYPLYIVWNLKYVNRIEQLDIRNLEHIPSQPGPGICSHGYIWNHKVNNILPHSYSVFPLRCYCLMSRQQHSSNRCYKLSSHLRPVLRSNFVQHWIPPTQLTDAIFGGVVARRGKLDDISIPRDSVVYGYHDHLRS